MRVHPNILTRSWSKSIGGAMVLGIALPLWGGEGEGASVGPLVTNLAQFQRLASGGRSDTWRVALEGTVWWVSADGERLVLADESGAAPVRLAFPGGPPRAGQRLGVEGRCTAQRSGMAFTLVPAVVVNNDGLHLPVEQSGSLELQAGWQPIRLCWFNRRGEAALKVAYEGPDLPRQRIPPAALACQELAAPASMTNLVQGLQYRCWEGQWGHVPDFDPWPVGAHGRVADFDIAVRTRPENVGLEFTGFVKIPRNGRYTFFVESDDGSLLFVGQPALRVTPPDSTCPPPLRLAIGAPLAGVDEFRLCEVEGEVTAVYTRERVASLELQSGRERLRLELADRAGCCPEVLSGSWLRATGIVHGVDTLDGRRVVGALWCPTWQQVEVVAVSASRWGEIPLPTAADWAAASRSKGAPAVARVRGTVQAVERGVSLLLSNETGLVTVVCGHPTAAQVGDPVEAAGHVVLSGDRAMLADAVVQEQSLDSSTPGLPLLTRIRQVRGLSPEAAARNYPVRVRGVVTGRFINALGLVIQDQEQGIYVLVEDASTRGLLNIGDACEVIGVSLPGYFAPMIEARELRRLGLSTLPEPILPTRDQVLNGSLDAQYVEIQGIVTAAKEGWVQLLTRAGVVELTEMNPEGTSQQKWTQFENALVRVRGCVFAGYDRATGLLRSGLLRIIEPTVTVLEAAPTDPFALPLRPVATLRGFDPQASAFQRVRVAGQLIQAQPDLYCLMDGTNGLRFYPRDALHLPRGASIEVVGVLDLGGFSPVLRQALVRPRSGGELPEPRRLAATNLISGSHEATRVQVESRLLNVSRRREDQVLELRTGDHLHTARLHTQLGMLPPLAVGSRVAVQGVYLGRGGDWAAGRGIEDFELVLGSPADIVVLEKPSWWTARRILGLAGVLAAVLVAALAWIRVLHYQVRERTTQLAREIQARQRIEQQQALERERGRLARDLHDDLGGGLTEISLLGALAADGSVPAAKRATYLNQLTDKARQLVAALDEIVWTANPRYDSVPSLAGYCSLHAQRLLGLANVRCHLDVPEDLPNHPLDSRQRHGLFLAFKEALNNAVRHARASEVRVRIEVADGQLVLAVSDNGRGFDPTAPAGEGDGLVNLRARLLDLGGQCRIQSAPGEGTTVELRLGLSEALHDPGGDS